jgi:hypothetical protein
MNWKGFGRKPPRPNRCTTPEFAWKDRGKRSKPQTGRDSNRAPHEYVHAGLYHKSLIKFYGKDFSLLHSIQTYSGAYPASYSMGRFFHPNLKISFMQTFRVAQSIKWLIHSRWFTERTAFCRRASRNTKRLHTKGLKGVPCHDERDPLDSRTCKTAVDFPITSTVLVSLNAQHKDQSTNIGNYSWLNMCNYNTISVSA